MGIDLSTEDGRRLQFIRLRAGLAMKDRDPLTYFHFGVERAKDACALFSARNPIDELHIRACNKGLKTTLVAAYVLACAQKRQTLDGVPLPRWRRQVECAQLVLDYPQQLLSVQPAYLRMLGQWPHHARYKGQILSSLHVQPVGGDSDESTWSVIHFLSQENRRSGVGVRGDVIAFDEPPRIEILRELRKAAHAGRRSIILIGETPTIRSQWGPLKEDYGDQARSTLRRVDSERAEVRWSLHEIADWVLSAEEKAKLKRRYWGAPEREKPVDPLYEARMHGDYCDTSGDCPFDVYALRAMIAECDERPAPEEMEWKITRQVESEGGLRKVVAKVKVLVLKQPEPGRRYYLNIDPSAGIEQGDHDPGAILVSEYETGEDVAMYEGYIGPYGLGVLAATLGKQYNTATVDPENNAGWGIGVLQGLSDAGYGNIARERREFNGEFRNVLGFQTNESSRRAMIGEVIEWVQAYAAGAGYARCGFRRVLETMLDVILDDEDKIVAAPGFHDEFLILKGQSLRKTRPRKPDMNLSRPLVIRQPKDPDLTLAELFAGKEERPVGNGKIIPRPRRRPV